MSFGGSVSAMIASLKHNSRPKRKTYFDRNLDDKNSEDKIHPLLKKKASPSQLKKIREEVLKDNRRKGLTQIVYFIFAVVIIISFLWYINS